MPELQHRTCKATTPAIRASKTRSKDRLSSLRLSLRHKKSGAFSATRSTSAGSSGSGTSYAGCSDTVYAGDFDTVYAGDPDTSHRPFGRSDADTCAGAICCGESSAASSR